MRGLLPTVVCLAGLTVCLPLRAQGLETPDMHYCIELIELYVRYIGDPLTAPKAVRRYDGAVDDAISNCRLGNTITAIPVLERKLTDNGVPLPPRPQSP